MKMNAVREKQKLVMLEEWKLEKELDEVVADMWEKEKICELLNMNIANDISKTRKSTGITLLQDENTPEKVTLDELDFKLQKDGNKIFYKVSNEDYFRVTIRYKKRKKEFEIETLPQYVNFDAIMKHGFEPQRYISTFKLRPLSEHTNV